MINRIKKLWRPKASEAYPDINSGKLEPPNSPAREEIQERINAFNFWYHRIYLGKGVYTLDRPAYHEGVWNRLNEILPEDFGGASVLDVGCNAGYFCLQAKLRGAGRVTGLESYPDWFRQARLCKEIWNLDADYLPLDAHQLSEIKESYQIVVFTGILYHLKNPLMVLEEVGRICQDAVIVESEIIPTHPVGKVYVRLGPPGTEKFTECSTGFMKFIEKDELGNDGSNWWVPDTECVCAMLRTAGFAFFSPPLYMTKTRLLLAAGKTEKSILNLTALK